MLETTYNPWTGKFDWIGEAFVAAPVSPTSSGIAGQLAYDSDYLYVCIATDTWRRTQLSTWTVSSTPLLDEDGNPLLDEDGNPLYA